MRSSRFPLIAGRASPAAATNALDSVLLLYAVLGYTANASAVEVGLLRLNAA
jgi:hypothetical protein